MNTALHAMGSKRSKEEECTVLAAEAFYGLLKLRWNSAVHLILGSLDLMYHLTLPFLPLLPISELARDLALRVRAHQAQARRS